MRAPTADNRRAGAAPAAEALVGAIRRAIERTPARTVVFGLSGAQGSGKTTLAAASAAALRREGLTVAVLSLDDLYLRLAERKALARVHPLLRHRGPPGTHDVALGVAVLDGLTRGGMVRLPRFDKALDDRRAAGDWVEAAGRVDLVLFEGWCVGARPQAAEALAAPVNALERDEDGAGAWRRFVNASLAGAYQTLFARLDGLALLAAPSFSTVAAWRGQQEQALRRDLARQGRSTARCMSEAQIGRFVQLYQRLTEHILAEMPARADLVIRLDADRATT